MNRKEKIYNLLKKNRSVFLVGKSDSGKTYFVLNELIPFLKSKKMAVSYSYDCEHIKMPSKMGIAIIDEVETFQDKEFLEKNNITEEDFYEKKYIRRVNQWFRKLKATKIPSIYIVTRNNKKDIKYFQKNIKTTDWDKRKVGVMVFSRRTQLQTRNI